MNKLCLNMIVKNESAVIARCLGSLRPIIDYWVIVDTGSTDGTQQIILEALRGIAGELHERPWVNFAHNRNEALELAQKKADYLLFIDADDELLLMQRLPRLTLDYYSIQQRTDRVAAISGQIVFLVKSKLRWTWVGAVHETLLELPQRKGGLLAHVQNLYHHDGARSKDAQKSLRDAALLEDELTRDPNNGRAAAFAAISYEAAGEDALALAAFERRARMGGLQEELFYSLYRIAQLQRKLGHEPSVFLASYKRAYESRPSRVEPLYWLAHYYVSIKDFSSAYAQLKKGLHLPLPLEDGIYLEVPLYRYGMLYYFVKCAYQIARYSEALEALEALAAMDLPDEIRLQVEEALPPVRQMAAR